METKRRDGNSFAKKVLAVVSITVAFVGGVWLACQFSQVLLFTFAGLLLAILLRGIAEFVTRQTGMWIAASLGLTMFSFLGLLTAACWSIGPRFAAQSKDLTATLPKGVESARQTLEASWAGPLLGTLPPTAELLPSAKALWGHIPAFLTSTTEGIAMGIFILFLGIYLAAEPQIYRESLIRLVPKNFRQRMREVSELIAHALRWWLAGRIVTMAIMGLLTSLGLWLLGMPMALSLGLIAGVLQFVPYLGAIAAAIPAILIAFTQSPLMAAEVGILYLGIHLVEGYCVTPLIQRKAIAMPPAALLAMQVIMGVLFGIPGVILASPVMVVFVVMVQTLYLEDILEDEVEVLGTD